ncbi:MAG: ABC transporter substrate-binding protein [Anaerolineales bacterium]
MSTRRARMLMVAILTLGGLITACASADTPQPVEVEVTRIVAGTPETLVVTAEPEALEQIKIGFFSPLTGFAAQDGRDALDAALLAVELINEQGGVNGRPLQLIHFDDATAPDQAAAVVRKLVEQYGVVAVVSGSYSGPTRAAAPVLQELGVPMVAAYAVHPDITRTGEYIWRVGAMADVQGAAGAEVAVSELGAQKIAMLVTDIDFGISLATAFKTRAEQLGAEIVFETRYPLSETDFRPVISQIEASGADLVYTTGYPADGALFVRQASEEELAIQILGTEGIDSPIQFLAQAGDVAEGVVITTDLNRDSEREAVQAFLENFRERYGRDAGMVPASAYDAVQMVAEAIRLGKPTPEGVLEGLNLIENFEGAVTGPFMRITPGREVVRPIGAQIVRDGEFHFFAEIQNEEVIVPPQ